LLIVVTKLVVIDGGLPGLVEIAHLLAARKPEGKGRCD
jgi:hypothetical protein